MQGMAGTTSRHFPVTFVVSIFDPAEILPASTHVYRVRCIISLTTLACRPAERVQKHKNATKPMIIACRVRRVLCVCGRLLIHLSLSRFFEHRGVFRHTTFLNGHVFEQEPFGPRSIPGAKAVHSIPSNRRTRWGVSRVVCPCKRLCHPPHQTGISAWSV